MGESSIDMKWMFNKPEGEDWRELKNPCYGEIEEIEDEVEKRFKLFRNFDVIARPPIDHRYLIGGGSRKTDDYMDMIIHKEWEILESSLPASIYVRGYKTRPDLLRAVIIGPEATSYCHGLFFFDISIPCKYPVQPLDISYLYCGLEINPYLNRHGKVSLDLLSSGLWSKLTLHKRHKWNPEKSTILEVLISIQCTVLKDTSYPALPIRDNIIDGYKSLKYDKNVFVPLCKSMLEVLHYPPMGFEVFVAGHFRKQAHPILMICKDIMDASVPKDPIHQLFKQLIKAFEANGAYCRHHYTRKQETLKTNTGKNQTFEANGVHNQQESYLGIDRTTRAQNFKEHLMDLLV